MDTSSQDIEENGDTTDAKYEGNRIPDRQFVDGHPFPPKNLFFEDKIRSALQYQPDDTDTFVVTFPKCGTTWMQYIIWDIVHRTLKTPPNMNNMISACIPYLELVGGTAVHQMEKPRFIKTHLPFHLNPYNAQCKYIYVARNPRDCCVSLYHFIRSISLYRFTDGSFDDFFESFLSGETPFGDFFDHVMSWYERRNDPNVMFLTYEQMQAGHEDSILRVARFLGEDYYEPIVADPSLLKKIRERTTFESMSTCNAYYRPSTERAAQIAPLLNGRFPNAIDDCEPVKGFKKVNFFRKGIVGSWKELMSEEQETRMSQTMLEKMGDTELYAAWMALY